MSQLEQLTANMQRIAQQVEVAKGRIQRQEERDKYLSGRVMELSHESFRLREERNGLVKLMQEAVDNCETCRGETGARRCARCQTFAEAISGLAD